MSTTGAIGYIDQNGNYRATAVFADADPEGDVGRHFPRMLYKMGPEGFIQWVEAGIAGGGYDGLYNHETLKERGDAEGPYLIDAHNYDSSFIDFMYVVADGKISFFDPKNVMEYDDEWLES
jgi:hypothetical protein